VGFVNYAPFHNFFICFAQKQDAMLRISQEDAQRKTAKEKKKEKEV